MDKKIEFNWKIHNRCNYRCPYCFNYGQWAELSKLDRYFSPDKLIDAWRKIYKKYGSVHIKIAGGEPFIYPNFFELVKELSKGHTIEIITNLSCNKEKLSAFLSQIDPTRVMLFLSFHPLFESFEIFVEKALIVKEKGFGSGINFVAYPPELKRMEYFKDKFEIRGLNFLPLPFRGLYKDIIYPGGYTENEKKLIYGYCAPKDDSSEQKANLKAMLSPPKTKGRLCYAGQKFACIESNGTVYRCSDSRNTILGDFFDKDFILFEKPMPCEIDTCPCEFKWLVKKGDGDGNVQAPAPFNFRNEIPPFKIFFTWDIHYSCNYKCPYCFFNKLWEQHYVENRYPGIERWIEIWNEVFEKYGSCHVHITGGECSIYPDFFKLVKEISKIHSVTVDTNLSFNVSAVIGKLSPYNVNFAATYHPLFADFNLFLEKSAKLKNNNFEIYAELVAYPLQLEKIQVCRVEFAKIDVPLRISPFRGEFNGKSYPEGYSQQERILIEDYHVNSATQLQMTWYGKEQEKEKRANKICRMGQMYAKIRADGSVYRCCKIKEPTKMLGNMLEGSFKLMDEASPCEYSSDCNCWKAMFLGEENKWLPHWTVPTDKFNSAEAK